MSFLCVVVLISSFFHAPELLPTWGVVIEDVEPTPNLDKAKLGLIRFLEEREEYITGDEVRRRAVKLRANLGLSDAKYLLEHQAEISKKFRNKRILLPGTVLQGVDGSHHVPYLFWHDGRWSLGFTWLDCYFGSYFSILRTEEF